LPKILVSLSEELIQLIDEKREKLKVSRSFYIEQVCRKHLNLPNMFEESKVVE
jgi:metal-responsive CopG/Arc/MetJ family transcriptional regulator